MSPSQLYSNTELVWLNKKKNHRIHSTFKSLWDSSSGHVVAPKCLSIFCCSGKVDPFFCKNKGVDVEVSDCIQ